jgi:hypothetical protein
MPSWVQYHASVPADQTLAQSPLKLGGAWLSSIGSFRNNQWQSGDLQTKVEHLIFASRQVEGAY